MLSSVARFRNCKDLGLRTSSILVRVLDRKLRVRFGTLVAAAFDSISDEVP
jgi:hypothetical protein